MFVFTRVPRFGANNKIAQTKLKNNELYGFTNE